MSAQFGRWDFDGQPVSPEQLKVIETQLAPYGPDVTSIWSYGGVNILYCALQILRDELTRQPYISRSGLVVVWNGRLDNHSEIIEQLGSELSTASSDVEIAAAAYEHWSTACFARLVGDWSFTLWDAAAGVLILAKDPIGLQPLYYTREDRRLSWSSLLDPLTSLAEQGLKISEEYLAGCFAFYPAAHLTPYVGIYSVPPSTYVRCSIAKTEITKYWDFNPEKRIRYRTDAEYEEHFRSVFEQSVRRRLRSHLPVVAELSGGIDSSSIVCMADMIAAKGTSEAPRISTISYYDNSEPAWDERPYFTAVEQSRGESGCHIEITSDETFRIRFDSSRFPVTPSSFTQATDAAQQFATHLRSRGSRIVLSGSGGDEVLGGIPTPLPELRDLIAQARLKTLARQLELWALTKRKSWFSLFFQAARGFLPDNLAGFRGLESPAPWLTREFVARNEEAIAGYENRTKLFGALPSFQENLNALNGLRRQLAYTDLPHDPPYEKRYPYLDIELLEFVYAIPREQLVRPGCRRSLMRRALAGIVPAEVLNRRRKAFPARRPMFALASEWKHLSAEQDPLVTRLFGMVDEKRFFQALERAARGEQVAIVQIIRTLSVEYWLRSIHHWITEGSEKAGVQIKLLVRTPSMTTASL
jgi:asparagine synthase (glutamine-hydrolysing)